VYVHLCEHSVLNKKIKVSKNKFEVPTEGSGSNMFTVTWFEFKNRSWTLNNEQMNTNIHISVKHIKPSLKPNFWSLWEQARYQLGKGYKGKPLYSRS
jgi:hypothetical protein